MPNTKEVFKLRKEAKELQGGSKLNKLTEAKNLGEQLYGVSPHDEWTQKALSYVLIDLCKYYLSTSRNQSTIFYNRLNQVFQHTDEIISNQKDYLESKLDSSIDKVNEAVNLSKDGNHTGAINIFKNLIANNSLSHLHHEKYGWAIYRYIKNSSNELPSVDVRRLLKNYLDLNNERPSLLHSLILNVALNYSKNSDFNFYNFLKIWNLHLFRDEDRNEETFEDKIFKPLTNRVLRELVERNYEIDIDYLVDNMPMPEYVILEFLRESYFWKLYNYNENHNYNDMWKWFTTYNDKFSQYGESEYNSKILSLANRLMKDENEVRFYDFFKTWNPDNLQNKDWEETRKEEQVYPPLAMNSLKKVCRIALEKGKPDVDWLIKLCDKSITHKSDEWIKRNKGRLLLQIGEHELAVSTYRDLVLELGDKYYVWSEFSKCIQEDKDLKLSMLCKAVLLEKNEDFLGEVRLEIAEILTEKGLYENALLELNKYAEHRQLKSWKIPKKFDNLNSKIPNNTLPEHGNKTLYYKYVGLADEFAYDNIEWIEVVLAEKWETNDNKTKCKFSDNNGLEFIIPEHRYKLLKNSKLGSVFNAKLHKKNRPDGSSFYRVLLLNKLDAPKWSILNDEIAVIDYINKERGVLHLITYSHKAVFSKTDIRNFKVNDFVIGKELTLNAREGKKKTLVGIKIIDKNEVLDKFKSCKVIIDYVNATECFFYYYGFKEFQGKLNFDSVNIIPEVGKILNAWYVMKSNTKTHKSSPKIISIEELETTDEDFFEVIDMLEISFNDNYKPKFGFIRGYYVPSHLLERKKITENGYIAAKISRVGDRVIDLY